MASENSVTNFMSVTWLKVPNVQLVILFNLLLLKGIAAIFSLMTNKCVRPATPRKKCLVPVPPATLTIWKNPNTIQKHCSSVYTMAEGNNTNHHKNCLFRKPRCFFIVYVPALHPFNVVFLSWRQDLLNHITVYWGACYTSIGEPCNISNNKVYAFELP